MGFSKSLAWSGGGANWSGGSVTYLSEELAADSVDKILTVQDGRVVAPSELKVIPDLLTPAQYAGLLAVRELLLREVTQAHAPATSTYVACALETGNGIYLGHNHEASYSKYDKNSRHAEVNALEQKEAEGDPEPFERMYVLRAAKDPRGETFKQVAPCFNCYDTLQPNLSPDAELVVFEPQTFGRAMVFSAEEHADAYASKEPSAITGETREEISQELSLKTALRGKDVELVTDLRLEGLAHDIRFYLSGTASGRGWIAQPMRRKLGRKPYRDIDIIAVPPGYPYDPHDSLSYSGKIAKQVADIAESYLSHKLNTAMFERMYLHGHEVGFHRPVVRDLGNGRLGSTVIDLVVAIDLPSGMVEPDYYARNFYHQLS